jgi:hypothetical protein
MQRRRNYGAVLDVDEDDEDEVYIFLDKYDLKKQYVILHQRSFFYLHSEIYLLVQKLAFFLLFRKRSCLLPLHHCNSSALGVPMRMDMLLNNQIPSLSARLTMYRLSL